MSAPVRVDFGGGWSDTPPFCIDWGGSVLNAALTLRGSYPIRTTIRIIPEPVVRCYVSDGPGRSIEWQDSESLAGETRPGSPFAVPAAVLQMAQLASEETSLESFLEAYGGGLEFRTAVDVPMGSGLGTSSILGATVIRAMTEMLGIALTDEALVAQVSVLEQRLTTGGGWQDQAGGVFPGVKLVTSTPGAEQKLRMAQVEWTGELRREFEERFILYYTGIARVAKDLLTQVVGGYLAREVDSLQVLHNIKALAVEMARAMSAGDWPCLGSLMDRHWEMNKILDPYTTNAAIEACLRSLRPCLAGAKLAGAGGGGFLMLLASSSEAARSLRECLSAEGPGELYEYDLAEEGIQISVEG